MRVIAVANQKGGVGKTTTAVNVAAFLAAWGHSTLLVDMDPQGNATSGLGVAAEPGRPSSYSVVLEGRPPAEAIVSTTSGVDLIPSDIALAGAEIELIDLARRENRLMYALEGPSAAYEFAIVDCPPSLGLLTLNALVAARHLLVPLQCEFYALEALGRLASTLDLVRRQANPGLELLGIAMCLFDGRTTLSHQVVAEVRRGYPDLVFDSIIPRNVRLSEAPSYGMSIVQYDARSRGGRAYEALTHEILGRLGLEVPSPAVTAAQEEHHDVS